MDLLVRERRDDDVAVLLDIATAVEVGDSYPPRMPRDFRAFIVADDAIARWVAEKDGRVVGQAVLNRRSSDEIMRIASRATGRQPDGLGVVARLFVDKDARRHGVARALLDEAVRGAHDRGLWPVLDVAQHFAPAVALYESAGWRRAGATTFTFSDGYTLRSYVYTGPSPDSAVRG